MGSVEGSDREGTGEGVLRQVGKAGHPCVGKEAVTAACNKTGACDLFVCHKALKVDTDTVIDGDRPQPRTRVQPNEK